MDQFDELERFADLVRTWNAINRALGRFLGRSASSGHITEDIASRIIHILLEQRANHPVSDGTFTAGALAGKSVNVKWRGGGSRTVNVKDVNHLPDYFLSFVGPKKSAITDPSPGYHPFSIKEVCLFEAETLATLLREKGKEKGHMTSVQKQVWDQARIYPQHEHSPIRLTPEQETMLALFTGLD